MPKENSLSEVARKYHSQDTPGKISLKPTKPCDNQQELALAYTPGVAVLCLDIKSHPEDVWKYTSKGNLVAVISDGSAVLGLGNIGPEAGIPVMEGKAVLFKKFADIDVFPLCLGTVCGTDGQPDPDKIIEIVKHLEPSFGGVNLEDIAAPACFKVEQTLKQIMSIPVFHDDQHGTAIISLAGILNALKLVGKNIEEARFVVNGAGAAGIACAEFYILAGARRENFLMCDSKGVIHAGRNDLNAEKKRFAAVTSARTLAEAMEGADVFVGVSVANCVSADMVKSMAPEPVIFALANPTPEILPEDAWNAGARVVGTGRSDFPNQVNNVLGFPGIFRGALDVRATDINEEMKLAASRALVELMLEPIPPHIRTALEAAYPQDVGNGMFDGNIPLKPTLVIPKPFDPRVVPRVARYVAAAAMASGVARKTIDDLDKYEDVVAERIRRNNVYDL